MRLNQESSPVNGNKHSKSHHPSRKKPHEVACDGYSRSQQTEADRENNSAEQEVEKDDRFHDLRRSRHFRHRQHPAATPERSNAIVAIKPPRRAMFVPAARTPMKAQAADGCNREDPKRHRRAKQKEVAHAHRGWALREERAQRLGWREGVTKGAPCRSIAAATRPATKMTMWTIASRIRDGPRNRGVDFVM